MKKHVSLVISSKYDTCKLMGSRKMSLTKDKRMFNTIFATPTDSFDLIVTLKQLFG